MRDVIVESHPVNRQTLLEYANIPISFTVRSVFNVEPVDGGLGGIILREEKADKQYVKDYDALDGEGPTRWLKTFDTGNWRLFIARHSGKLVGGVTVATRTPEVHMLKGRTDLVVVWDVRVHPDHRRSGIGTGLFSTATEWARGNGFRQLAVETQNTNVPACKFYASQGCKLGEIDR
ncbi:MAG: GNAT family N-acetyltransferase, partial [Dehalococcoidia bacterium]|nr:GNAT family N-acetyltransferase [Dehalococcoidia bacterium]